MLPVAGIAAVGAGAYLLWPNPAEHARPFQPIKDSEKVPPPSKATEAWSTNPAQGIPIRYAKEGHASVKYPAIPEVFREAVKRCGDQPALLIEAKGYPSDKAGTWEETSWREYHAKSIAFAKALIDAGHEPFQSTAICGFNHPAWHIAHMGTILACGLSAGTYPTNSAEACQFVAEDSKAVVAAVDTVANAKKYLSKLGELPLLKRVVVWQEDVPADLKQKHNGLLMSFEEFLLSGKTIADSKVSEREAMCKVENAATLIYTSGTTGNPKAVMVSHDAMLYSANVVLSVSDTEFHKMISYLPLSHIAAQILDIFIPLCYAANRKPGQKCCSIYFARPDVLKGSLPITLKAVRPHFFFGVPRVWEKFVEAIKAKAKANPATGLKKMIVDFAKDVGLKASYARQTGGSGYIPRGYGFAKRKVFSAVREALGLDECVVCATGAAPIARETLEFLAALGIDVGEVYGMSETCGQGTTSMPYRFKFGSCGFITDSTELKLDHVEGRDKANEGEICFRGRHVMMGYMNNEAKTREAIDAEGWMHSGDIGRIDPDGHVYITGRIKELIIGAGGENIAPVPVEDTIKSLCPALSNVVMIGNKRKYNVCLVTLKSRQNLETGDYLDELVAEAAEVNPAVKTVSAARGDGKWRETITAAIEKYNKSAVSNAQKIQKFVILPKDLSIPGGELTPTMKLKRNVIEEKYSDEIEALYAGVDA